MYYPKSQIKTDLFTNGDEFYVKGDKNKKPYIGPYYKTSKNKCFVGKKPNINNRQLLPLDLEINQPPIPPSLKEIITTLDQTADDPHMGSNYEVDKYHKIYDNFTSRSIPNNIQSLPTDKDIKRGSYNRYFAKKANDNIFNEISKDTYSLFKNKDSTVAHELYEVSFFSFQTGGPGSGAPGSNPAETNTKQIESIEKNHNWKGFNLWCASQGIGGNKNAANNQKPLTRLNQNWDPNQNPNKISTPQTIWWNYYPNKKSNNNY
jgi:hypothetical protein